MFVLEPSNEVVRLRAEELEARVRRVVALAAAVSDMACLLPGGSREVDALQSLTTMLDTEAPAALGDLLWLIHSHSARSAQLDSIVLKSVA